MPIYMVPGRPVKQQGMKMEKMEEKGLHAKRQKGGLATMPFIFGKFLRFLEE